MEEGTTIPLRAERKKHSSAEMVEKGGCLGIESATGTPGDRRERARALLKGHVPVTSMDASCQLLSGSHI